MALLDELASGVAPAGSPELLRDFHLTPALAAGWTLVAMQLLAVVEAPLLALTARWQRRSLLAVSQLAVAGTCAWAAASPSHWLLLAALLLYGPATGMACATAQAALVDRAPDDAERVLSRWAIYQCAGDLLAPLLLSVLALAGSGWRAAFLVAAGVAAAQAIVVLAGPALPQPGPASAEERAKGGSLRAAILWCGAGVLCTLMDEALVSFGGLHLAALGATPATRGAVLAAAMVGAAGALAIAGRVASGMRLLLVASAGCAAAFAGFLFATSLPVNAALLVLTFALAAPLHPIVSARAYAALPGRSTAVNVIASAMSTVELAIPLALGAIADRFGVRAALAVMIVQPGALVIVSAAVLLRVRASR
ncbi:MAG: MFS transporter [Myxococcales bacterium]